MFGIFFDKNGVKSKRFGRETTQIREGDLPIGINGNGRDVLLFHTTVGHPRIIVIREITINNLRIHQGSVFFLTPDPHAAEEGTTFKVSYEGTEFNMVLVSYSF